MLEEIQQQNTMQVLIQDFQILQKVKLEFGYGLTTIVGQSNNGKSSILKALQALFYTTPRYNSNKTGCKSIHISSSI